MIAKDADKTEHDSPLRAEITGYFVESAQALGLPKSLGEIYSVVFLSEKALCMADITEKLGISIGTASQGLRQLRQLKAIRTVYLPGDRRDYYVAETELRRLMANFLSEVIQPQIDSGIERLQRAEDLIQKLPPAEQDQYAQRINKLKQWNQRSGKVLPLISKWIKI